jgi:hypothetical protein
LVTWSFDRLPLSVAVPICALLLAWQSSLQHESIHGVARPLAPSYLPKSVRCVSACPATLFEGQFGAARQPSDDIRPLSIRGFDPQAKHDKRLA